MNNEEGISGVKICSKCGPYRGSFDTCPHCIVDEVDPVAGPRAQVADAVADSPIDIKVFCEKHQTLHPKGALCLYCRDEDEDDSPEPAPKAQKTGGSVDYYKCHVADPVSGGPAYTAESLDIIEALGMTFAEGEAFKAIWRTCTGRMGGAVKADDNPKYNAEKVQFFGGRMVKAAERDKPTS